MKKTGVNLFLTLTIFLFVIGFQSNDALGTDYCVAPAGDGSSTATWTPDLPEAGLYRVYAKWISDTDRATDAPYTIYYDGGSEPILMNQRTLGSRWNLLGTWDFAAGMSGYVVLSNDTATGKVVADAVRFVLVSNPEIDIVVDNFVTMGEWTCEATVLPVPQDLGTYDTLVTQYTAETCRGCHGNTAADAARHHATLVAIPNCPDGSSDNCAGCHTDLVDYSNITSDCLECHDQAHHISDLSGSAQCTACHEPDLVAAIRSVKTSSYYPAAATQPTPFDCANCHVSADVQPGVPMAIYSNFDTHHMGFKGNVASACADCHSNNPNNPSWDPYNPLLIRYCENCHSKDSLHGIKAHVTAGQGLTAEDKCVACHGAVPVFNLTPFLRQLAVGPPSVTSIDPLFGAAGTSCTITGQNFDKQGDIRLTARAGQTDQTYSVSWKDCTWEDDTIEFTLPAGLTPGSYNVKVETKSGISNLRVFTVTGTAAIPCPETAPSIDSIKATLGVAPLVITIDGSNFGDRHTSDRNVLMQQEGVDLKLPIYSWTDKKIQAYVPAWVFYWDSHAVKVETEQGESNSVDFTLRKHPTLNAINYDSATRTLTLSGEGFGNSVQYVGEDGYGWMSQVKLASKTKLGVPDTVLSITEDNIQAWSDLEIRLTLPVEIPTGVYGVAVETVYFFDTNSNNTYGEGDQKYQTVQSDPKRLELL